MSGAIVASDVRLERDGPTLRLSCAVHDPDHALPERLWYELDEHHADLVRPHGDGFLPPLLAAAMARRRPLHIDGSVAAEHLEGSARVMEVHLRFSAAAGDALAGVAVTASRPRADDPRGAATGVFFSGGVDSFYTLLSNRARYPAGDARRITHMVVLHGYDLALDQHALFARLLRECGEIGARIPAEPVRVRTNVRAALAGLHWNRYGFGTVLAGAALALTPGLHTIYVPSGGRPFLDMAQLPTAIQPEITGWWSTRAHELVYDPLHVPRRDKVRLLVEERWAIPYLRVCWENRGGAYNCGECEKCLRTMVELTLAGADTDSPFPSPLDLDRLRAERLPPRARMYWQELWTQAAALPEHAAIAQALEEMLAGDAWRGSRAGRADAWLSSVLARVGLTASRAKALDARVLGGLTAAGYRRVQRLIRGAGRAGDA